MRGDTGTAGWYRVFVRAAACAATAVGVVVLIGWWLDLGVVRNVIPSLPTMKPNTALGFVLLGIALLLVQSGGVAPWRSHLGAAAAALASLVGLLTLLEYWSGTALHFDRLLIGDATAGTASPARMAPATAFCFVVLGLALLSVSLKPRFYAGRFLALPAAAVALVALFGYAYDQSALHSSMAVHTSVLGIALSLAVLLAGPEQVLVVALSGLRTRLLLLVLVAVLPAFGLILWNSLEQRRDERENVEAVAVQLTRSISAQEVQVVQSARELLSQLAVAPQVVGGDVAACRAYLAGVAAIERRYSGFGVANLDGDMACSTSDLPTPLNVADRAYFQRVLATGEFALGDYVLARISAATPVLPLAYPMFDERGELVGMVASGITLDWLNEFSAGLAIPKDAVLVVIDPSGVVLARRPDPDTWVGKSVQATEVGRAVLSEATGTAELTGLDGRQRLFAFAPLGGAARNDAYVAVGLSTASAYAGLNRTLTRNLSLLGAVTLIALLAAWFGGDWLLLRGVRALNVAAERVRAGDLSARTGARPGAGEVAQLAGTFDQMAESLEQRDAALRESEERFRSFVEHAADGIFMVNQQGTLVSANPAAELMFGYSKDEIVGQPVDLLLPERLRTAHVAQPGAFWAAPGVRAGLDLSARRKDGSEFPVVIGLTPLSPGEDRLVAASVRDITERKRAEEQLEQTVQNLVRSNAELEQFAYVASHDLQEPLRMVSNYTQLLARRYRGKLDDDADEFIGFAVEGATRMQMLINDLLSLSRIQTCGQEFGPTETEDVLARAVASLQASIVESGAEVTHGPLPVVRGDGVQLGQLLQNLIGNAIKFRKPDVAPRVHLSAERDGASWRFSVQDNGIGIDPSYHDRIFVTFQRLHSREQYPGTGIGLAVCKKVVERHGGRIWMESAPGEGTTFRFTLRAEDVERPEAAAERAAA